MRKWVIYCAGNSEYILSENKEPIKMLKSFQKHFGSELDYVYFTDINENRIDEVEQLCIDNNIKLVKGDCKKNYNQYTDIQFTQKGEKGRWPDAMYWYCDGPEYLKSNYDYAIKCDGDMLCNSHFELSELESDLAISIAEAPNWYDPFDKHSPNAGFQIINISEYVEQNISSLFKQASKQITRFNSDTPALDYFVGSNQIIVSYLSSDYNYLLFDVDEVNSLKLEDVSTVKIFHFVDSKPHSLNEKMKGSIKEYFSKIYLKNEKI
jgi:hypothetical protein